MVFSSSSVVGFTRFGDSYYFIKRQLLWFVVGVFLLAITTRIDYRRHIALAWPGATVTLALLGAVLVIGQTLGGTKGWLNLGFLHLQPVEVAKLGTVLFFAGHFNAHRDELARFRGLVAPLAVLGSMLALIMLQPDFGSGLVLAGTGFLMLLAAGARLGHLFGLASLGVPMAVALATMEPYRMERLLAFWNPWKDPQDTGYQIIQSLMAIGSGGLFGLGLGQSRQKFSYLPENHTDFIFSIIGEELGLVGTVLVLTLLFVFAWRGYRAALLAPDYYGSLLAVGITTMITLQALMNIGVISGVLPVTGITLPFISYGGSSLAITLIGVGILLNISRGATRS